MSRLAHPASGADVYRHADQSDDVALFAGAVWRETLRYYQLTIGSNS